MNVLTIAALVIMVFCMLRGWKRGIIMWIYGVAAWIFIMLFVTVAHNILFNVYMENEDIYGKVYGTVRPYVEKYIPETTENGIDKNKTIKAIDNIMSGGMPIDGDTLANVDADVLREFGIDVPKEYEGIVNGVIDKIANGADSIEGITEELSEGASNAGNMLRETTVDVATETAVKYILRALAVLTAYLIAKVICIIVKIILTVLTENALIRTPVHIAGALLGLAEAVMYIWVALYGIRILSVTDIGAVMAAQVRSSTLLSYLDENNMLAGFLGYLLEM